jgi:spermidine synthase
VIELFRSLKPYVIVFTASGCTLIIEIVAGRILAPTIGVSLYTWTSIIGIVLAGISIGNYIGGRVADRYPSPSTVGLILLAGGVASMGILPVDHFVSDRFLTLPIIPRIVMLTVALFLVPAVILGMVTPVVIKLRLADLAETGNVVGKLYAVSTAGSILGTFLTGFVLVQLFGTRLVILIVSLVLVAMAIAFGNLWRVRIPSIALGAVFVAIIGVSVVGDGLDSGCERESNYYCIKVRARDIEDREVRVLYLDALVHSYVDTDDPMFLHYSYEKVFGDLATTMAHSDPDLDTLFIGGGGYTMPKFMEALFPDANLEVVEIDPEVTEVAFEYLALPPDTNIVTYPEDARTKLQELPKGKYEFIVGDAFNDVSVPYHLTTLEFDEMVRGLLSDEGVYAINVVDRMHSGRFLRSVVHTLQSVFPHVYVMRDDSRWDNDDRYTFIVAASMKPITAVEVTSANLLEGRGSPVTQFMPKDAFASWIADERKVVLTDDFVPVDGMLAPLYLQSRTE